MDEPTPFADLNGVLDQLLEGIRASLGPNFCGLYLQGSFAIGDADAYSDVDFIVATNDEVSDEELERLQGLHDRLFALDVAWAQHLEGSYVPTASLRRKDADRRTYLFLDNGATELVHDNHCNTDVVRWVLREHGVRLAGPDARTLIDPVTAGQLNREMLATVDEYVEWAPEPTKAGRMSRWKQPYLVTTLCRILHTLETGRVSTKRASLEWSREALPSEWRSLIQQALDDRPDPWRRVHEAADERTIEETLAFVDWAAATAKTRPRTR
jgi:hypothetical protein